MKSILLPTLPLLTLTASPALAAGPSGSFSSTLVLLIGANLLLMGLLGLCAAVLLSALRDRWQRVRRHSQLQRSRAARPGSLAYAQAAVQPRRHQQTR